MVKKKILIVNDDPQVVKKIVSTIKEADYEVEVAYDGIQGVQKAREQRPDLIIIDFKAPAGDGLGLLENLQSMPEIATSPIIFISFDSGEKIPKKLLDLGAKDFMSDPLDEKELLAKVNKYLVGADKGHKKILIVEDEPHTLQIVKDRLESNGFEVITAIDGEEALATAKKEKPNLIILDVMLPKMDGFHVCRLLKFEEEYKSIPIIMVTAKATQADLDIGKQTGANAYIVKPFDFDALLLTMERLLQK